MKKINGDHHHVAKRTAILLAAGAFMLVSFIGIQSGSGDLNNSQPSGELLNKSSTTKMNAMQQASASTGAASISSELKSLSLATGWLNSKPLTGMDLKGKVVLINFWTYTCINWIRTLPYIRAWAEKYQDKGLVVIGVHTPEFSFEKNPDNVRKLTNDLGVRFHVAMDNSYDIWNAFNNQYWPALYLVDAKGKIRHQQFGEGDYDQAEKLIRQLLTESGATALDEHDVAVAPEELEIAADWSTLNSAENYLGYQRTEHFVSIGGARPDRRQLYAAPQTLMLNQWALTGEWTMQQESVLLSKANGKISYGFQARDLHMVMGPLVHSSPVRFRVLIDGHAPGADHGIDVDAEGYGIIKDQRLYHLVRQRSGVQQRHFEIEFLDPGLEAFNFTFG